MPANAVWNFLQWIHYLALSAWIGGIAFLAAIAAPSIHRSMVSRPVAGELVGMMLRRFNRIEMLCSLLLIVTSFSSQRFLQVQGGWVPVLMLVFVIVLMGGLTTYYTYYLDPRMHQIRLSTPTLDTLSAKNPLKIEFDRLHKRYVRLMSLNLVLGLLVLYGSVVIFKI